MSGNFPIPVLYFHSVAPQPDRRWYKSRLTTSLKLFEQIITFFANKGFAFIDLDEYLERSGSCSGSRKCICITFDDGYLDNYVYAYPVLKKHSAKGTIFVSPEFVDPQSGARPTIEDVWKCGFKESNLVSSGFLSWEEMRRMEDSGIIDIQSHTLTHTKVFSGSGLRDFHNPNADWLYPVSNLFPERKPFYITDPGFPELIQWGTPFFTEASAVTTRKILFNDEFIKYCRERLSGVNWASYSFSECLPKIQSVYHAMLENRTLVRCIETETEYQNRLFKEIAKSKTIIERSLSKTVNHICWPHGDYNQLCIDRAFDAGYRSVHAVPGKGPVPHRSFTRIGVTEDRASVPLSFLRVVAKVEALRGRQPYALVAFISRLLSGMRGKPCL